MRKMSEDYRELKRLNSNLLQQIGLLDEHLKKQQQERELIEERVSHFDDLELSRKELLFKVGTLESRLNLEISLREIVENKVDM